MGTEVIKNARTRLAVTAAMASLRESQYTNLGLAGIDSCTMPSREVGF